VVRDSVARQEAIDSVVAFIAGQGLRVLGLMDSPVPGPAGNVEALLVARQQGERPAPP
jgi:23S rRNA (cytidine1920-2'-O)/16S rRNA (cytidine1409-2'-O)-methyltransferase